MHIRIIKLSGKLHGIKVNLENDVENIEIFANEGTPVIIVSDLEDLEAFGISPTDVQMSK